MSLPIESDNEPNFDRHQSKLSSTSSGMIERIGQWIDHQEWDVLDQDADLHSDIQTCLELLHLGSKVTIQSFGFASAESQQDEAGGTPISNRIKDPTVVELNENRPEFFHAGEQSDGQSASRFSNPELIGTGGFGIVFRVIDQRLGMPIAIKIMRPSKSRSQELRIRFLGEAQTTATLSHPGIVRIFDTGHIDSLPYITSAFAKDGSLARWLAKNRKALSPRQAGMFLAQVASAVHYAHSKATLHRDLKPGNILIELAEDAMSEAGVMRPILTDFGLAKRLDRATDQPNLTREGGVLGTTRYMSPEQARGALQDIGTTSDIFALGIILYELLTGKLPFDSPSDHTVHNLIVAANPERPRANNATISRDLEAITLKCLAKEPTDRYQTAHELWLDLQRYLKGEPVEADKSNWLRRAAHSVRRHPFVVSLLVISGLTSTLAIVGLSFALSQEHAAREIERLSRVREQAAAQSETKAREGERLANKSKVDALALLASVLMDLADDIFAGTQIKSENLLVSLQKSIGAMQEYVTQSPDDVNLIHRLSVLRYHASIAYQRNGNIAQCINERLAVLKLLDDVLKLKPGNTTCRFQRFQTLNFLGDTLVGAPKLREAFPSLDVTALYSESLAIIESLAVEHPEKIDYLDAMGAAKISNAIYSWQTDPNRGKQLILESIELSKRLWHEHPDRPLLAKHAILGLAMLARKELGTPDLPAAYEHCSESVQLLNEAWGHASHELWVLLEVVKVYGIWTDVLVEGENWDLALVALDKRESALVSLGKKIPDKIPQLIQRVANRIQRIEILKRKGQSDDLIVQAKEQLVDFIEGEKGQSGFYKALRENLDNLKLPVEVEVVLTQSVTPN